MTAILNLSEGLLGAGLPLVSVVDLKGGFADPVLIHKGCGTRASS